MTQIPSGAGAGMAFIANEAFVGALELFAGESPTPVSEDGYVVDDTLIGAADLLEYSVVGLSGGKIVLAKTTSTAVIPIGITISRVIMGSTDKRVAIYRAGCFNQDALTWHADYDTDAKKKVAFAAGGVPTNIIIKKFRYAGVTSNPTS